MGPVRMNKRLRSIAEEYSLDSEPRADFRLRFALQCVGRIRPLLEMSEVVELLDLGMSYPDQCSLAEVQEAASAAANFAHSHPGSKSIDGAGHAAVSATFAVARALAADAWNAAEYAAYALAYSYGASTVTDPSAFEAEYDWQCQLLEGMIRQMRLLPTESK